MPVLTAIDIIGIQSYIYASNRLRDVLAASWMVEHATSPEMLQAQPAPSKGRVRLAAAGNAIIEFDSEDDAKQWTRYYTRALHDTAPGLEVVVAHRPYPRGRLAWGLKALQIELARAKSERRPSAPQLGLSVTASCGITGLPAEGVEQGDLVSAGIRALRNSVVHAKQRWAEFHRPLDTAPGWTAEFPDVFDLMGRTSDVTSLLGVVHVDGNGIGDAIQRWLDRCLDEELGDDEVWEQYEAWSGAIIELGKSVLGSVVERVAGSVVGGKDGCKLRGTPHHLGFDLTSKNGAKSASPKKTVFLPVRPILLGGDDLTFVCDGRIALDLAVTALRQFAEKPVPHLGENGEDCKLTACAGVALVKAHAPFRSSYQLAEDLCQSAKFRRRAMQFGNADDCWIDWHIGATRPGDSIQEVRARQYRCRDGRDATMRPYPLGAHGRMQSWQWLDKLVLGPGDRAQAEDQSFRGASHWADSRNRVKRLSSLVSEGSASVDRQLEAWRIVEPRLTLPGGFDSNVAPGFIGSQTPLRDAIELLDVHLRLEPDVHVSGVAPADTTDRVANEEGR